jgi:Leucine-rich repeat (LRR) protein
MFYIFLRLGLMLSLLITPLPASASPTTSPLSAEFTTCENIIGILPMECEALFALYNSTDGANWTDNTGWLQTDMPCDWYGVTCSEGHVARLELSGNELNGSIPPEVGNLHFLNYLQLAFNQLSSNIPTSIGGLSNLEYLYLANNQLTGDIPSELGELSNLLYLQLSLNQLTGSIPPELGDLTNLIDLRLSSNQLGGNIPIQLGSLQNLRYLYLNNNQFSNNIPSELGSLSNLQYLYLHSNQLSGSIPTELGDLASLLRLNLGGNQLTSNIPPKLADLANLQYLFMNSNQLTGSIPPELRNLTNLEQMSIGGNQLTGNIPPELGDLNNLKILDLSYNQLTGNLPSSIGNLVNVVSLYLINNQLEGEIPLSIINLINLSELSLSCGLTSADPDVIEFLNQVSNGWRCSNARFAIHVAQNSVEGYDWTPGTEITLSIDDPNNGIGWDYTDTTHVYGNGYIYFSDLNGFFDGITLVPGMTVKVTDGTITKFQTIPDFALTNVDAANDTVEGTGIEGDQIFSQWCGEGTCYRRWSTVEANGTWLADFSTAGVTPEEQDTLDITPGMEGISSLRDSDNDSIFYRWIWREFDYPFIYAPTVGNGMFLFNWEENTVDIEIPDGPQQYNGFDYSIENLYIDDGAYNLHLGDFGLNPGTVVTVTDGPITKTLTIRDISILEANATEDTASGGSDIMNGSLHVLGECGSDKVRLTTPTDGDGNWNVDFSPSLDLEIGCLITVMAYDEDGDKTFAWWEIPNPSFIVYETQNRLRARNWSLGSYLTIYVYEGETLLYTSSPFGPVISRNVGNPSTTLEGINLDTFVDIKPGMTVKVSDGVTEKEMIIPASIAVAHIDHEADTISGTADPDASLRAFSLELFGNWRDITADENGVWLADFSTGEYPLDITPDKDGFISITDDDGDSVWQQWMDRDGDGTPDLIDACPGDAENNCVTEASAAQFIGINGGSLSPQNESITMSVASGALSERDFGVPASEDTNAESVFTLTTYTDGVYDTDQGDTHAVLASHIEPSGSTFDEETSIAFTWSDTNNDGIVDGTLKNEADLYISKDGVVIAGPCSSDAGCDMDANTYTVQVTSLSFFVLGTLEEKVTFKSTASQDGHILESTETSNKGGSLNSKATTFNLGDDAFNRQYRAILSFNTSSIPTGAEITSVTLRLKRQGVTGGGNPINTFKGFMVDIKTGNFGTAALQLADFNAKSNQVLGPFKPALSGGWYKINLTAARNRINTNGNTQIRLRFKVDDNNNLTANFLKLYSGNAGVTSRPQLIVEYYVP